jgi:site-specific DNA-methyltransferase (adenine-specific)
VKNNHGTGDLSGAYAPKHEFVLFGEKGRCLRNENVKRTPDVLFYDKIASKKLQHPTEKPINMLEDFINAYGLTTAIVLDPFMGSGTTGVACVNTNRNFIGIELDENYFNIAKKRIETARGDYETV